ncbi:MAG: DMT family transporter [Actinomyces sp.]|nr:DMT family transporter [Actinomyces sp.]MDN6429334.1 DMT family transporter [Propionibacterium sp.]MDN6793749.1 DMT family transporter [Propionibacterium sp.]
MIGGVLAGISVGLVLPVQTTINTRLGRRMGSVFAASLVSFSVGTLVLLVALGVTRPGIAWDTLPRQPWWIWSGGLCGVAFLTFNIVLMRALGASSAVVLPIVGQVVGGVLIDATGALGATRVALGPTRGAGALLVVLGAVLANMRPRRGGVSADDQGGPGRLRVLALGGAAVLTGTLSAVQATVNGRLGVVSGSALLAAAVSFVVGTLTLVVVVSALRVQPRLREVTATEPWWIWIGGVLGAGFVLANSAIAPVLGTGLTVSVVLLGQIVLGLVVDHVGLLGAPRRPVGALRVLGALTVLAGVALVRLV